MTLFYWLRGIVADHLFKYLFLSLIILNIQQFCLFSQDLIKHVKTGINNTST